MNKTSLSPSLPSFSLLTRVGWRGVEALEPSFPTLPFAVLLGFLTRQDGCFDGILGEDQVALGDASVVNVGLVECVEDPRFI